MPSSMKGCAACRPGSRRATLSATSRVGHRAGSMTNSSPPRRHSVSVSRRQRLQALGHQLQHAVADQVAERVVDDLEAVQVEEQHGEAGVALARTLDGGVHALRQQQAVGQAGEHVAVGQFLDALLRRVLQVRSRMKPMLCTSRPSSSRSATHDSCTAQWTPFVAGQPQFALPESLARPPTAGPAPSGWNRAPLPNRARGAAAFVRRWLSEPTSRSQPGFIRRIRCWLSAMKIASRLDSKTRAARRRLACISVWRVMSR